MKQEENIQEQNIEQNIDENNVNEQVDVSAIQSQLNEQIQLNSKLTQTNKDFFEEMKSLKSKVNEFQSAAQSEREKELLQSGNQEGFKQLLDERLKNATSQFDETIQNVSKEKEELQNKLQELEIQAKKNDFRNKFSGILSQTDIDSKAYNRVTELAMNNSEIVNGKIVFKDENGIAKTRNNKGKEYTELDFINELRTSEPYYFQNIQGTDNKQGSTNGSGILEITSKELSEKMSGMSKIEVEKLESDLISGKILLID